jgi:hypothetical protein
MARPPTPRALNAFRQTILWNERLEKFAAATAATLTTAAR